MNKQDEKFPKVSTWVPASQGADVNIAITAKDATLWAAQQKAAKHG